MRPVFYFPATAAILLRTHTWLMNEFAIANWLRSYGRGGHSDGQPFLVKSRQPGPHYYRLTAGDGGFLITSGQLSELASCTPKTG